MIGALIDQPVGGLIGPKCVIIDLLIVVDVEQRIGAGRRLGIATIKKARAVVRPRGAGKLDPLQMIAPVLLRRDVAHAELLPVRAAPGCAVHERATVPSGEKVLGSSRTLGSAVRESCI